MTGRTSRRKWAVAGELVLVTLAAALVAPGSWTTAGVPAPAQDTGKQPPARARVDRTVFGIMPDGTKVIEFRMTNTKGASVAVLTYGATVRELRVPDKIGLNADVVLGFADLPSYLGAHPHFGGVIGRYANRIAGGKFTVDGREYQLALNNGPNTLHGGVLGFDRKVWAGEQLPSLAEAGVRMTYTSPDGEENFPGSVTATVVYTLSNENELKIEYTATTDKATPINLTNHSYFNLRGDGSSVLDYVVTVNADKYTPVNDVLIPTGELAPVAGTPYDFLINYAVNGKPGKLRKAARVEDPLSGRAMEVWTTQPGLQFYDAIGLNGTLKGKGDIAYPKYGAVCLETQDYPDAVHHPNFPNVVLKPGQTYNRVTVYKFFAK